MKMSLSLSIQKYREVMATGKYDHVMNYFGESVEHYGKKNAQTYFAEACLKITFDSNSM